MDTTQFSAVAAGPANLLAQPENAFVCRTLLLAGEDGLPAAELAGRVGLSLGRAARVFEALLQANVLALSVRDRKVCYRLRASAEIDRALQALAAARGDIRR
ncbi:ArsR family transcriptional regulator [Cupriavidus sp. AU9028]|uniref:ArsR family transcriptional regulator n=1 Tax=Cupriavidus sp. AU9028 TaxID=2871157 RepID=UPI001C96C231|nr:ArsR family transcriptional regulator [Cupriavidus sp. AU9028]MBY4895522.1 ArsR family transcriptional regulator [Cupriavidus sp. AU9028]